LSLKRESTAMIDIDETRSNIPLIGIAALVAVAAFGGWYYWHAHQVPPAPAPVAVETPPTPVAEDVIQHPVAMASPDASKPPLPSLNESDAAFNEALRDATQSSGAPAWVAEGIIRHLVVTVDNLPRQKIAVEKRPLAAIPGPFLADGDELRATIDPNNFKRYSPLVSAIEKVDMPRIVAVYVRFYPLFQQAYQDLGYPNGYFNDRLVQVIDNLLATPQVTGPIELVRPNVLYLYVDPALEARSAGQKLLLRMGPDNAAAIKARLTELRAALVTAAP